MNSNPKDIPVKYMRISHFYKLCNILNQNNFLENLVCMLPKKPQEDTSSFYTHDDVQIFKYSENPSKALLESWWKEAGSTVSCLKDCLRQANLHLAADFLTVEVLGEEMCSYRTLNCNSLNIKYSLDTVLGEGGFGKVHLGLDCESMQTVVVKILHPDIDYKLFITEVEISMKLNHMNLLRLLDAQFHGDTRYLVYEYMCNGSLADRLVCKDCTAPFTWAQRVAILVGSAMGISYLHKSRLIHRDIKSANILLDENFCAKIGDFGCIRPLSENSTSLQTNTIIGTNVYMPHEAFSGDVSNKWDIYSFGVVMLEALTGLPALDHNREIALLTDYTDPEEMELREISVMDITDERKTDEWKWVCFNNLYLLARDCLLKKNRRPTIANVIERLTSISPSG